MINEFIQYQAENKGLSSQTIEAYRKDLRAWVKYAKPRGIRWSTCSKQDIEDYLLHEKERGLQPRTLRRRIEILRLIFKWMQHRELRADNPAWTTETPKVADTLPKAANMRTIDGYLATTPTTRQAYIIHLLTALIADTGMRIGEALALEGRDIDFERKEIRVKGKGNKERVVYYGKRLAAYEGALKATQERIFREDAMTYRYMMISEMPGMHPHAIRHAFACDQLNKGMTIETLSKLMGHTNTTTTQIYAKLCDATARREYRSIN